MHLWLLLVFAVGIMVCGGAYLWTQAWALLFAIGGLYLAALLVIKDWLRNARNRSEHQLQ